jgi:hypothetical protein
MNWKYKDPDGSNTKEGNKIFNKKVEKQKTN